jgi:glutathione S-transferase
LKLILREESKDQMNMKLELYFSPGACSRVTLIALEETGAPFETHLLAFMAGEHRQPDYLRLNPAGKVPTLVAGGEPITQNVAILTFLARNFPQAELLPASSSLLEEARLLGMLVTFTADLHPIVTRIAFPQLMVENADSANLLRAKAKEVMKSQLAPYELRLASQDWLAGDAWSILDAYLFWIWGRITGAGFDPTPFPAIASHFARVEQRPSVQRALAREAEAVGILDGRGLMMRPKP